jgi:hypothetical protein
VKLVGVKVLDGDGAGTNSGVLAGMNFGKFDLQQLLPHSLRCLLF